MCLDIFEENITKEGNAILVRINKMIQINSNVDVYNWQMYICNDWTKKFHSMYDTYILECDNIYFVFCRQTANNISWNVIIWGNLLDVTHRRYKWRTLRMKYHNIIQLTPCIRNITLQWFLFTTLPCLVPQAIRIIKCKISLFQLISKM